MAEHDLERELERLSAYIDDELTPEERRAVEARLAQDPALREAVNEMRQNAHLLTGLPRVKAPRNFTLDPAVYGRRARGFNWWGVRIAGAMGAVASVMLAIGVVLILSTGLRPPAAPPAATNAAVSMLQETQTQAVEAEAQMTATASAFAREGIETAEDMGDQAMAQLAAGAPTATIALMGDATAAPGADEGYAALDAAARAAATASPAPTQAMTPVAPAAMITASPTEMALRGTTEPSASLPPPHPLPDTGGGVPSDGAEAPAIALEAAGGGPGESAPPATPTQIPPRTATPPPTATATDTSTPPPTAPPPPTEAATATSPATSTVTATHTPTFTGTPTSTATPAEVASAGEAPRAAEERASAQEAMRRAIDPGPALIMAGVALLLLASTLYLFARFRRR